MTPDRLEQAAFWDLSVCLDCEATFETPSRDGDGDPCCPQCGRDAVYKAEFILRVSQAIRPEEPF